MTNPDEDDTRMIGGFHGDEPEDRGYADDPDSAIPDEPGAAERTVQAPVPGPTPQQEKRDNPATRMPRGYESPPRIWLLVGLGLFAVDAVLWLLLPDAARSNGRIVALQVIADPAAADALDVGRGPILRSLLFDLVLIAAYVTTLFWLALWAGRFYRVESVRRRRWYVAWTVVGAGAADLVEDLLLLIGVVSNYSTGGAFPALWTVMAMMAWAKFVVLTLAIGFVIVGAAGRITTSNDALWPILWGQGAESTDTITDVLDRQAGAGRRDLGIALSGGGIRSASISLGTLQVLERPDLPGDAMGWWQAAEVTAISGGSNMAGSWSITRTTRRDQEAPGGVVDGNPDAWSWDAEEDELTPEERHLMENLGYLASRTPRGDASDPTSPTKEGDDIPPPVPSWRPSSYATVLSGFLVNALLLLLCLWLAALPLGWFFGWLAGLPTGCPERSLDARLGCLAGETQLVLPTVLWLLVGLLGTVAWVGAGRVTSRKPVLLGLRVVTLFGWGIGLTLLGVLVAFPYLMLLAGQAAAGNASLFSVLGALGSLGAVARILRTPAVKYAPVVGGLVFALLVLFLTAYWANGAATRSSLIDGASPVTDGAFGWYGVTWWLVGVAVLVALWALVSPESWSMAPFYRGKLRLAYATFRRGTVAWPYSNDSGTTGMEPRWEPSLHTYLTRAQAPHRGTPLTICASCTVSNRGVKTHYGVPALSTTFTPESVTMFVPEDDLGRWRSWTCDTDQMDLLSRRGNGSRLTTMLAVAISSAAVAPAMGRYKVGPTSALLTFANMRLGVWMPNPRYVAQLTEQGITMPMVRLGYLFKEFFGLHDPSDLFVYLTDGGHWENTGLVELLRKGDFREVVCVDADPGPGDAVKSISEAIDLAYLETGARVHLDLDPLRAARGDGRAPEYSERSVSVGFFETAAGHVGLLWYTKPALTEDMPASLLAHRETHPDFPRTSTLDQFFDLSTFIAYRNLGRHNARVIRTARERLLADMDAAQVAWQNAGSTGPRDGDGAGPRPATAFDAFCALGECGWAARELAGLIRRRTPSAERQQELWDGVYETLREAGREQAGAAGSGVPAEMPGQRTETDTPSRAGSGVSAGS